MNRVRVRRNWSAPRPWVGLAVGGPVLTALTIKLDRRRILVGSLAAFLLVAATPVLISDYDLFLVARVGAGALQGLFIAAAFMIGPSVVQPQQAGRAISIVLSGFAVSTAAGVPIGTVIGHELGWRGAFVAVLVVVSVVLVTALVVIPSTPSVGGGAAGRRGRLALPSPRACSHCSACSSWSSPRTRRR